MRWNPHNSVLLSSVLAAASLWWSSAAGQAIVSTSKVTDGPVGKAVNEVAIARQNTDDDAKTVVLSNVQDPPPQGEQQAPIEIGYAVSPDGGVTWQPEQTLPFPAGSTAELDCSVLFYSGFVASGIARLPDKDNAYVVKMPLGSNTFDPQTMVHFDNEDVAFTRLGRSTRQIGGNELLYLMVRSQDFGTADEIGVRTSADLAGR